MDKATIKKTRELVDLAECRDKPVKRLCIDFGLYIDTMLGSKIINMEEVFKSYIDDYKEMITESEDKEGRFKQLSILDV